ncbi:MAG: septal ring lytic transglycosylase RlpA family protein [Pseudomonadota bacterium]
MKKQIVFGLTNIVLCLVIASCSEIRFASEAYKRIRYDTGVRERDLSEQQKERYGTYKIGKPYVIKGKKYFPKLDYEYDEVGIASWYGRQFHGRLTANGAVFDMNRVSAAHKTLPLPSWVEVTNIENGKKLKILVNDRGPYADNRIIDLSRQAAHLLGFEKQGLARVRVKVLREQSLQLVSFLKNKQGKSLTKKMPKLASVEENHTGKTKAKTIIKDQSGKIPTKLFAQNSKSKASDKNDGQNQQHKKLLYHKQNVQNNTIVEDNKIIITEISDFGTMSPAFEGSKAGDIVPKSEISVMMILLSSTMVLFCTFCL